MNCHTFSSMLAVSLASLLSMSVAWASAPMVKTQAPGFYRMMVGEVEVTALLDANEPWPENVEVLFPALSKEQRSALRQRTHLQPQNDFSTIAYVINTGKKLIMVDTGGRGAPNYGQLFANLAAAGYQPEQVDDIFITHMHPDHIGGLSQDGQRSFPNAVLHADRRELPQWQAAAAKGNATAAAIVARIEPYVAAQRFQPFDGDTQFTPEFRTIAAYGHTDGHSFYAIESKGSVMRFWGDFIVNDKVQFELPDAVPPGEKDAAKGIALRRKEFAQVAQQQSWIAGAHFSFPGIGQVRDLGGKFIWVPADYALLVQPSGAQ